MFRKSSIFAERQAPRNDGVLLIEGIGGIMVPLDECHTVLDLMLALDLPLVLVAGSYLGTLSHVLSAQDVILRHALELRAIVVSESECSAVPLDATLGTLFKFRQSPVAWFAAASSGKSKRCGLSATGRADRLNARASYVEEAAPCNAASIFSALLVLDRCDGRGLFDAREFSSFLIVARGRALKFAFHGLKLRLAFQLRPFRVGSGNRLIGETVWQRPFLAHEILCLRNVGPNFRMHQGVKRRGAQL